VLHRLPSLSLNILPLPVTSEIIPFDTAASMDDILYDKFGNYNCRSTRASNASDFSSLSQQSSSSDPPWCALHPNPHAGREGLPLCLPHTSERPPLVASLCAPNPAAFRAVRRLPNA
jgi:hypothetical protein